MRKQHEQAIIDIFFDRFKRVAAQKKISFYRFALDGQDKDVADYLFSDKAWFALVEFKYEEKDIKAENQKPRRLRLCENLVGNEYRERQHDECHFIGWSKTDSSKSRSIIFNIYRLEVCSHEIWGPDKQTLAEHSDKTKRVTADSFVTNFLEKSKNYGAEYENFQSYLNWLLGRDGSSTASDLELITYDENQDYLEIHEFESLASLKKWFDDKAPKQTEDYSPTM